jgi:thiosulfate reductase cytochrome b subunit
MKQRTIFRWIHIILSIPIVGYIYSPFDTLPQFANYVRFGYAPMIILTGLWMWKGHVVRRLIWKRLVKQDAADNAISTELISQHQ